MKRIVIFGNSGSGKATLAKLLSAEQGLAHLDLDTLAWEPTHPPSRLPLEASIERMDRFMAEHDSWVIEGCYADLLEHAATQADEMIFLDLPVEACVANARARPWEPHKYESKEAQDANLDMLIDWISAYTEREDTFSRQAHQALFDSFHGYKMRYSHNHRPLGIISQG